MTTWLLGNSDLSRLNPAQDTRWTNSAAVLLVDRKGFNGTLDYHEPTETSLAKLRLLVVSAS
jgi:hypothetical protein